MRTIVYSHGFAVRKDGRGMFTELAGALEDFRHEMFDYDKVEEKDGKIFLTARTIEKNIEKLEEKMAQVRVNDPEGEICVVAHSRGCMVALLADLGKFGVKKLILLAPALETGDVAEKARNYWRKREGSYVMENGTTFMPRGDGSVTLIPQAYWDSYAKFQEVDLAELMNRRAEEGVEVFVIEAGEDEILGKQDFSGLSDKVRFETIDGVGHNFLDDGRREKLAGAMRKILK